MNLNISNKLYTILIIMLPILGVYKSPVYFFDLGTFLVLASFPFILYKSKGTILNNKTLIILLAYIFTASIYIFAHEFMLLLPILRTVKFLIMIFAVLLLGYHKLFDAEYAIKILKVITNVAVMYLIVQIVLYRGFGILLPNGFPMLADNSGYLSNIYISAIRPSSFFLEPAHFAQYSIVYLTYCIFGIESHQKLFKNWKNALFITVGIILSTSGQGILMVVILMSIWLLLNIAKKKIKLQNIIYTFCMIMLLLIALPLIMKTEVVTNLLTRIFTENISGGGNALYARVSGYTILQNLNGIHSIIGMGFGNVPENMYLSGYAYIIYCTGYLGLAIFITLLTSTFLKVHKFSKVLVVLFAIMLIGAQMFTATSICFYFAIFYISKSKHTNIKDNNFEQIKKIESW